MRFIIKKETHFGKLGFLLLEYEKIVVSLQY